MLRENILVRTNVLTGFLSRLFLVPTRRIQSSSLESAKTESFFTSTSIPTVHALQGPRFPTGVRLSHKNRPVASIRPRSRQGRSPAVPEHMLPGQVLRHGGFTLRTRFGTAGFCGPVQLGRDRASPAGFPHRGLPRRLPGRSPKFAGSAGPSSTGGLFPRESWVENEVSPISCHRDRVPWNLLGPPQQPEVSARRQGHRDLGPTSSIAIHAVLVEEGRHVSRQDAQFYRLRNPPRETPLAKPTTLSLRLTRVDPKETLLHSPQRSHRPTLVDVHSAHAVRHISTEEVRVLVDRRFGLGLGRPGQRPTITGSLVDRAEAMAHQSERDVRRAPSSFQGSRGPGALVGRSPVRQQNGRRLHPQPRRHQIGDSGPRRCAFTGDGGIGGHAPSGAFNSGPVQRCR